ACRPWGERRRLTPADIEGVGGATGGAGTGEPRALRGVPREQQRGDTEPGKARAQGAPRGQARSPSKRPSKPGRKIFDRRLKVRQFTRETSTARPCFVRCAEEPSRF